MPSLSITGITVSALTGERLANAKVTLYSNQPDSTLQDQSVLTDDKGNFTFDVSDVTQYPNGDYELVANYGAQYNVRLDVKLDRANPPADLVLSLNKYKTSKWTGVIFTLLLLAGLVSVLTLSYKLHHTWPVDHSKDLLPVLGLAVAQIPVDSTMLATRDSVPVHSFKLDSSMSVYRALQSFSSLFDSTYKKLDMDTMVKAKMIRDVTGLAFASTTFPELRTNLQSLEKLVDNTGTGFKLWSTFPYIYLEILFWALFATLIKIIINNGYHIYKGTFRKWAVAQQVALVFCTPILALLISMIISIVSFSIDLDGVQLKVDLSNVFIASIIAALIGLSPWRAWEYLESLSAYMFKRLPVPASKSNPAPAAEADAEESANGGTANNGGAGTNQ